MKDKLTQKEIEERFAMINNRKPETPTEDEAASLQQAEAMDDGTSVSLDKLKDELSGYSGRILLRIPKSLHKTLKQEAEIEGVSFNQYLIYRLSH